MDCELCGGTGHSSGRCSVRQTALMDFLRQLHPGGEWVPASEKLLPQAGLAPQGERVVVAAPSHRESAGRPSESPRPTPPTAPPAPAAPAAPSRFLAALPSRFEAPSLPIDVASAPRLPGFGPPPPPAPAAPGRADVPGPPALSEADLEALDRLVESESASTGREG